MATYVKDNELYVDGLPMDKGLWDDLLNELLYLQDNPQDENNSLEFLNCVENCVIITRSALDKVEEQVKQLKAKLS